MKEKILKKYKNQAGTQTLSHRNQRKIEKYFIKNYIYWIKTGKEVIKKY